MAEQVGVERVVRSQPRVSLRDTWDTLKSNKPLGYLCAASFFYLANRGILLPPGPDDQWTLSVQHDDADIDRYVETFRAFAGELTA